jgi:hypothetical protein
MVLCNILQHAVDHHTDAQVHSGVTMALPWSGHHVLALASVSTALFGAKRPCAEKEEATQRLLVVNANLSQLFRFPGPVLSTLRRPGCRLFDVGETPWRSSPPGIQSI